MNSSASSRSATDGIERPGGVEEGEEQGGVVSCWRWPGADESAPVVKELARRGVELACAGLESSRLAGGSDFFLAESPESPQIPRPVRENPA
jgi:hypothetical protein